jgi:hypothetical protein
MKLVAALGIVAVFVVASTLRYRPPPARGVDAPPDEFSAGRAREVLRELVGSGEPHPTGSPAGARVRSGIVAHLERLGYRTELHEAFACGAVRVCARVTNVLARLDGMRGGKAVLLSVHYDSVAAGPGASDDGVGVAAALEVARALKASAPLKNPIIFLFNEGEEDHLLGAEAFTSGDAWAKEVGAVVNLEARGTTGPSLMFETSDDGGWIIDLFARSVARPASNSIYYTVYKLLPNDTDLTVYKRRGLPGLNFAFIGGEPRYHTPRDDFAHADPGSLQHHGDNALAMVRAFAGADLDTRRGTELTFFDVLAFGVVRWPQRWMPLLAVVAVLLLVVAAARAIWRSELQATAVGWGILAFIVGVLGTAAVGAVISLVVHAAGAVPYRWVAHPAFARAAFLAAPVLATGLAAVWLGRRAGATGLWWGAWSLWGIAALSTGFAAPGLSYALVVPCLAAGLCALAGARCLALFVPLAVAALLWSPVVWLLYDALGVPILTGSGVLLAVVLATAAPAWIEAGPRVRDGVTFAAAAAVVVGTIAAASMAPFSPDNPRKLNLWYRLDTERQQAAWLASSNTGPLPPQLTEAAAFARTPVAALEWVPTLRAYPAPAPQLALSAPELSLVEQREVPTGRLLRAQLRSTRSAPVAGFAIPRDRVLSVRINGVPANDAASKKRVGTSLTAVPEWRSYVCTTVGAARLDVDLEVSGTGPVDVHIWDASSGLPEAGKQLVAARPSWAVPFDTGDRTVVVAKTRL